MTASKISVSGIWWNILSGLKAMAEKIARSPKQLAKLLQRVVAMLDGSVSLRKCYDDVLALVRFLHAWSSRRYISVPWKVIVSIIMALLYLVMPADAIPDVLPLVGLTDDASVIAFVVAMIRQHLDDFRAWEAVQAS